MNIKHYLLVFVSIIALFLGCTDYQDEIQTAYDEYRSGYDSTLKANRGVTDCECGVVLKSKFVTKNTVIYGAQNTVFRVDNCIFSDDSASALDSVEIGWDSVNFFGVSEADYSIALDVDSSFEPTAFVKYGDSTQKLQCPEVSVSPLSSSSSDESSSSSEPLCSGKIYNEIIQICIDGTIMLRCGTAGYDLETEKCVDGKVLSICGDSTYDSETRICIDGEIKLRCGTAGYDMKTEKCVDGKVVSICGGKEYDPDESFCLNGAVYDFCESKTFDPKKERCVGGKLRPLCGSIAYDPENKTCVDGLLKSMCNGVAYESSRYKCESGELKALCGKVTYDSTLYFCRDSQIMGYCGSETYFTSAFACLDGELFSLCGGIPYDRNHFICNSGSLTNTRKVIMLNNEGSVMDLSQNTLPGEQFGYLSLDASVLDSCSYSSDSDALYFESDGVVQNRGCKIKIRNDNVSSSTQIAHVKVKVFLNKQLMNGDGYYQLDYNVTLPAIDQELPEVFNFILEKLDSDPKYSYADGVSTWMGVTPKIANRLQVELYVSMIASEGFSKIAPNRYAFDSDGENPVRYTIDVDRGNISSVDGTGYLIYLMSRSSL